MACSPLPGRGPLSAVTDAPRTCGPFFPKAAPNRPRGSFCSVSVVPLAWPSRAGLRLRLTAHHCSGSSASAFGLVEPASAARASRASTPSEPRVAAADPSASAAELARQSSSGTAEARRRSRDCTARKHVAIPSCRCGAKFSVKPSLASPCGPGRRLIGRRRAQHWQLPLAPVC